jgi:hypothetical protein
MVRFRLLVDASLLLGLILFSCPGGALAAGADIAGSWIAQFDSDRGGREKIVYTFAEQDGVLSGRAASTARGSTREAEMFDVSLEGNRIAFSETLRFGQNELVIRCTGTVEGDEMKLTRKVGNFMTHEIVACREGSPAAIAAAEALAKIPPPMTAEEDHQRMMKLLGITGLRPGADGWNQDAPNAANYDESKVKQDLDLPDPLVMADGEAVTTPQMWRGKRRPELVEIFDREIFGRVPQNTPAVDWVVTDTKQESIGGVAVVTKNLVGRVENSACPWISVNIDLTLTTPAAAAGPVPVMMEFGWGGSFGPPPAGPTWKDLLLAKGWGFAIIVPTSYQADSGGGLTRGIIGLCNKGEPRGRDDWGVLRAWAWGASRALDYFETDDAVDAGRVGIEGLSRYGKAALVTMAFDERFAIGLIGSSGAGGAKIWRRDYGERLENIASSGEYHWMAGNFIKYAGPLTADDLPIDMHELVALCAPRPVFISCGTLEQGDGWVDAKGMFLAGVAAGPVYELLGGKGLGTAEFPPVETPLIDGDVAFRQHSAGHTVGPNWPTFLEFGERYLGG